MNMDINEEQKFFPSLPKIELHLHLDCSLSYDVVKKLRPGITALEYQQDFIAPEKCIDLVDFLACTSSGIELMQTAEQLRQVVGDLFAQLKRDNVIYAEIRFAPRLHLQRGLSAEEVVETVADSVKENINSTGIRAGVILCTLREYNEEQSFQIIRLVEKYIRHTLVVGFDMASDEAGFPIDAHLCAFEYAIKKGIPRTAHVGEAKGAESVWETLDQFKPQRIGHGVRSIEDPRLVEYLAQIGVHLEICPTCNIQTDIFETFADHPIDDLYRAGVSVGVNTDARSLVNVTLTDEYVKLANVFDWGAEQFYQCNTNSLSHAFISEGEKEELRQILNSGYGPYLNHR